jgi:phage tail protein X
MPTCEELLLNSLENYYTENPQKKEELKNIVDGKHKLSLRLIDWLVTHYAKVHNIFYWIYKANEGIYDKCPLDMADSKNVKKVNLYLDYRAQLKSYAKVNFDSFRRHNRISFCINFDKNEFIETTIGQLNFFRWAFSNNVIEYATQHYDKIYDHMINNNSYGKQKINGGNHSNIQDISKVMCTLRFD